MPQSGRCSGQPQAVYKAALSEWGARQAQAKKLCVCGVLSVARTLQNCVGSRDFSNSSNFDRLPTRACSCGVSGVASRHCQGCNNSKVATMTFEKLTIGYVLSYVTY